MITPPGRYLAIPSPVHDLDPRCKMVVLIGLAILSFFATEFSDFLLFYGFFMIIAYMSRVPMIMYLRSLKSVLVLAGLIMFFQVFFSFGRVIFEFGPLVVTAEGLLNGTILVARLFLAVLFSSVLSYTTEPLHMARAMEDIMRRIGIPSNTASATGITFAVAIKFIPILSEEAQRISLAQEARGARLNHGPFFRRISAMAAVVVPLMISSIRKAEELAIAMEVRNYGKGHKRTSNKDIA